MSRRERWKRWWTARGVIPRWQQVGAYLLIGIAAFVVFKSNGDTSDNANHAANQAKSASHDAQAAAHNAQAAIAAIQQQRKDLCKDQNKRRRKTIARLDFLITKLPPDERVRAKEIRASNVSLINALAPKRNCASITPNP